MKDIFKEEMPAKLYIQNGKVSESAPDKILKEKTPDNAILDSLHYDNEYSVAAKPSVRKNGNHLSG